MPLASSRSCSKVLFSPPHPHCSVWSIHKDLTWEEFGWRQRPLHTQHHQPCVWKVNIELRRRGLHGGWWCLCFSNLPFCFVQDVWDDLFPAPGERSEDLCLWLWSPDSWWEGWRDHHWSGEPIPVSIQLLLWPTTDVLHVGETVFGSSQGTWVRSIHTQDSFFFFFSFSIFCHFSSGINQWRDQLKPSQILENLARLKGLSKPRTEDNGTSLIFNGREYTLAEFGKLR